MRIVYVSYMHPAVAPGGAQQVAFELFEASLAAGHEAFLISALEAQHEAPYGKPGAPIVPVQGEPRQYFFFPQFYDYVHLSVGDWRSMQFFGDLIERLRPDVVHFHHYHRVGVEALRAARLAAPEAILALTFHEMMAICLADGQMVTTKTRQLCNAATPTGCHQCFEHLRPEFFTLRAQRLQALFDECDQFIFPSDFLADRYLAWGLPRQKCVVIQNGQKSLADGFDRHRHSLALNRFAFFGQFIDNKGIDLILKALLILVTESRVPRRGLVVEINGGNQSFASAAYLKTVKDLFDDLVARKNPGIEIIDRGSYGRADLAQRMATADWVVVPSTWWEVFGLVVSEAWMFGRPVIVADIAGLRERVTDGLDGYTFPVRDARALAERMAALAGHRSAWEATHAGIEAPWTADEMLDAHLAAWAEVLEDRVGTSHDLAMS